MGKRNSIIGALMSTPNYPRSRSSMFQELIAKITHSILGLALLLTTFTVGAQDGGEAKRTQELVPLKIKLPPPLFIGTPKNIRRPNLERQTGKPRGPFLAPVGAKNISVGKPVIASDDLPVIGDIEYVTDGDKDGSDGSYVEFGFAVQHVQIDLEAVHEMYAIILWHYHQQARVYIDCVIQVSDDKDFLTGVTTVFNNDHDNTAGLGVGKDKEWIEVNTGKLIDTKGIKGRYVRLYSNGNTSNDLNHYIEVEIWGKPAAE